MNDYKCTGEPPKLGGVVSCLFDLGAGVELGLGMGSKVYEGLGHPKPPSPKP